MLRRIGTISLLVGLAVPASAAQDAAQSAWAVLQKAGCAGCHNPDGVASATRLRFPENPASPAAIAEFGATLKPLIDRENPDNSLVLRKPTRRIAHAGGKRIEPGSPDEAALRAWVVELAKAEPTATRATAESHKPAPPILRRVTHAEYNNTIRDLLGDDSRIAESFPPEDFINGFKNQYQGQSISPLLAEAYASAAEKITRKAFGGDTSKFLPCKAAAPGCRERFIREFGLRAFRRPLEQTEVQRYQRLFATAGPKFDDGARLVMEAMLQSPNFLLRTENGSSTARRPYETASRLSYFLWATMPDEALLKAAAAGELNSPAGVERAARRLLKDSRAHDAMGEFLAEWLRFDRLSGTVRDRRTYPQFSPELITSMLGETRRLFDDLVWNGRNFTDFYAANYAIMSSDLASLYGVKPPAQEPGRVELAASTERAGVLGQATFLALTSKPADTSPTARGLFVREQFLCQEVPQPPPGVNTNLPALTKDKPQTNRRAPGYHLNQRKLRELPLAHRSHRIRL